MRCLGIAREIAALDAERLDSAAHRIFSREATMETDDRTGEREQD